MSNIIFNPKNVKRFNEQIETFHVILKNIMMRNVAMMTWWHSPKYYSRKISQTRAVDF